MFLGRRVLSLLSMIEWSNVCHRNPHKEELDVDAAFAMVAFQDPHVLRTLAAISAGVLKFAARLPKNGNQARGKAPLQYKRFTVRLRPHSALLSTTQNRPEPCGDD